MVCFEYNNFRFKGESQHENEKNCNDDDDGSDGYERHNMHGKCKRQPGSAETY